jgi:hypothetical protein
MEWNVEGVYKLVILIFFFFLCFLFPRKKGMEWNVDSTRGCGPAFVFLFFWGHSFDSKKYNFNKYKRILGKKINDPNSPYVEK